VELLQRKNTPIKKLREMIFGKRTERHQTRKAEGLEKVDESEKSEDGQPKAPVIKTRMRNCAQLEAGTGARLTEKLYERPDKWLALTAIEEAHIEENRFVVFTLVGSAVSSIPNRCAV
jgi:hypothetical protein